MSKQLLPLLLLLLCISVSYSQENLPEYVSPTPQAAALSKYSEYPIGNFTGIPSISVPLYELTSGDISLPLNLSYHAGGFKVTEEASWVGLGWTLSANNVITRTVNGVDDFYGTNTDGIEPYLGAPKIIDILQTNQFAHNGESEFSYRHQGTNDPLVNGVIEDYSIYIGDSFDWEPDVFSINVLGLNGKFILDQDGNAHFISQLDVEVTKTTTGWKVRTNDGFQYYFDQKESSTNFYGKLFSESWYLTKIISPTNREMTFIYQQDSYESSQYSYSDRAVESGGGTSYSGTQFNLDFDKITETKTKRVYLDSIKFDLGYVEFNLDTNLREDLKDGKKLSNFKVKDLNHNLIKEFEFQTSYFNTNSGVRGFLDNLIQFPEAEYSYYKKRLKLDKVIEKKGSESKEYQFTYSNLSLPNKDSFSQDYWGYYNGKTNQHLIASFEGELPYCFYATGNYYNSEWHVCSESNYCKYNGSDRNSNPTTMAANILEEIIYPTGGKTTFEFEANEYSNLDEVGEGYTYENFTKDVIIVGNIGNNNDVIQYSSATLPSDVVDILAPEVELVVYSTDSNPIDMSQMQQFLLSISTNGFNKSYNPSSFLDNQNTSYIDESVTGVIGGPINWTINNYFDQNANQTLIATFKCIIKRAYSPSKKYAGGLRVRQITHYDPISQDEVVKTYDYGYTDSGVDVSYGKLKTPTKFWSFHLPYIENIGGVGGTYVSFLPSNTHRLSLSQSSHIGYSKVVEKFGVNGESGRIEYNYHNSTNEIYDNLIRPHGIPNSKPELFDGKLDSIITYNNNVKVQKEMYEYDLLDEKIVKGIYQDGILKLAGAGGGAMGEFTFGKGGLHYYPIFSRWEAMSSKVTETYDLAGNLNTNSTTLYAYNSDNLLPTVVTTNDSKGNTLKTKTYYANDVGNTNYLTALGEALTSTEYNAINQLKKIKDNSSPGEYKTSIPIQVETYKNTSLLSRQRTNFGTWSGITHPKNVKTSKETANLDERIVYHSYDDKGNPTEISKSEGTHIVYIWGYQKQYPIAKIENATYSQVSSLLSSLQIDFDALTYADDDRTVDILNPNGTITKVGKEGDLREALRDLRESLPEAMVTTYTYDPLVGVTSVTDPRGQTVYYEYDDFNRLEFVRDVEGNILSENKYHYKGQ